MKINRRNILIGLPALLLATPAMAAIHPESALSSRDIERRRIKQQIADRIARLRELITINGSYGKPVDKSLHSILFHQDIARYLGNLKKKKTIFSYSTSYDNRNKTIRYSYKVFDGDPYTDKSIKLD